MPNADFPSPPSLSPPSTIRWAGFLVVGQGGLGVLTAIVLSVRALVGHDQSVASGYGTAAWFGILGGGVVAAGIALIMGKRWGRGIAIVAQVLLLPVAWSLTVSSKLPLVGVPVAVVVLAIVVLLFSKSAAQWMNAQYEQ